MAGPENGPNFIGSDQDVTDHNVEGGIPQEIIDISEAERAAFVLRVAEMDGMDLKQALKLAADLGLNV